MAKNKLNNRREEFLNFKGLVILNGRTVGDKLDEFTYIGGQGCSVNDICCENKYS